MVVDQAGSSSEWDVWKVTVNLLTLESVRCYKLKKIKIDMND